MFIIQIYQNAFQINLTCLFRNLDNHLAKSLTFHHAGVGSQNIDRCFAIHDHIGNNRFHGRCAVKDQAETAGCIKVWQLAVFWIYQPLGGVLFGTGKYFCNSASFCNDVVVDDGYLLANLFDNGHFVGDDDHSDA